jgi:hypothetical protein
MHGIGRVVSFKDSKHSFNYSLQSSLLSSATTQPTSRPFEYLCQMVSSFEGVNDIVVDYFGVANAAGCDYFGVANKDAE